MARSIKKGFYVHPSLMDKVEEAVKTDSRKPIRTWSRGSTITPDFLGLNLEVYNGKVFVPLHITDQMVGHKLGEFAATRSFRAHSAHTKK